MDTFLITAKIVGWVGVLILLSALLIVFRRRRIAENRAQAFHKRYKAPPVKERWRIRTGTPEPDDDDDLTGV